MITPIMNPPAKLVAFLASCMAINAQGVGATVVACDVPSGVSSDTGAASNDAVWADLTITFHRPKTGLRTKLGAALAGRVLVAPIGIPPDADRG